MNPLPASQHEVVVTHYITVVVRVTDGKIVFLSTGAYGSSHDSTIFKTIGFQSFLSPTERIFGDGAYIGDNRCITPFRKINLNAEQRKYNFVVSSLRIIVEQVIGQIKKFKCLQKWRGNDEDLCKIVFICGSICNFLFRKKKIRERPNPFYFF